MRFRGRREAVAHARYCKLQKSRDKLRDAGNCIEYTTLACGIVTQLFSPLLIQRLHGMGDVVMGSEFFSAAVLLRVARLLDITQ